MNKSGFLAPIMMASTEDVLILFTSDSLKSGEAKDDFASKMRLITAVYGGFRRRAHRGIQDHEGEAR